MSFRHLRNSWTQSQGEGAVSEMIQADKLEEEFLNVEWKFFECFSLLNTYSLGCKMQAEKGYLIIGLCILACLIQTRFSSAGKFWIHDQNKKMFQYFNKMVPQCAAEILRRFLKNCLSCTLASFWQSSLSSCPGKIDLLWISFVWPLVHLIITFNSKWETFCHERNK